MGRDGPQLCGGRPPEVSLGGRGTGGTPAAATRSRVGRRRLVFKNRAGRHTGHHWKNLTNVVYNQHFTAIFCNILDILSSKERLLIITVCRKGTHRSVAMLVVIELLCNFLRRPVTTHETSKQSWKMRSHICDYDSRTKEPKICNECDGMTRAVKVQKYKDIVQKL